MSEAVTDDPLVTFEEAARLDPDEFPGELDAGRWVPVTKSTWWHGTIAVNVGALLKAYARTHPGWSVSVGDPGTKLGRNPDILRGPDVGIVRRDRKPTGTGVEGWLEGAPDVAVEVLGDSQSTGQLMKKALEYLAAGGKAVWIVDPKAENVILVTPPDHVRVLGKDEVLDGGDALPGFSCRIGEFFEE